MLLVPPIMVISVWANTVGASGPSKLWNWGWCGTITVILSVLFGFSALIQVPQKGLRWYWQRVCRACAGKKNDKEADGVESMWYILAFMLLLTLCLGRAKPQAVPSPPPARPSAESKQPSRIARDPPDSTKAPHKKPIRQPSPAVTETKPADSAPKPPVHPEAHFEPVTKVVPDQQTVSPAEPKPAEKPAPPPEYRIWTDVTGKYRTEAAFAGVASGKVELKKRDGSTIHVPLEKLSKEDRQWVEDQEKGRNAEALGDVSRLEFERFAEACMTHV